jgi:hypothetical protein
MINATGNNRLQIVANNNNNNNNNNNSVALVCEETIPTERPRLVGEVSTNFYQYRGIAYSERWIPYSHNLGFLDRNPYNFFQVDPQL